MVERVAFVRWLCTLLGCTLALFWAACESTETGNPPFAAESLLRLDAKADDLAVIGLPGAVVPGGSYVEVTDLTTGLSANARSEEDGSFQLVIVGGKGPEISIRIWNRGGSSEIPRTSPSALDGGPEEPDDADDGADAARTVTASPDAGSVTNVSDAGAQPDAQTALAECERLASEARRRIASIRESAACGETCQAIPTHTSCFSSCVVAVDTSGVAGVEAELDLLEQEVCAPYTALSCPALAERCDDLGLPCLNDACTRPEGPEVTDVTRM